MDFLQNELGGWYYIDEKGEPFSGILFETYSNNALAYEGQYKSGYKMGYQRFWYENGHLEEEFTICWDHPHGSCTAWNENGTLSFEAEYKYGHRIWSRTYDNKENLVKEYRIDNHPQDLSNLNAWISTLKKGGSIEKWDEATQDKSDK